MNVLKFKMQYVYEISVFLKQHLVVKKLFISSRLFQWNVSIIIIIFAFRMHVFIMKRISESVLFITKFVSDIRCLMLAIYFAIKNNFALFLLLQLSANNNSDYYNFVPSLFLLVLNLRLKRNSFSTFFCTVLLRFCYAYIMSQNASLSLLLNLII